MKSLGIKKIPVKDIAFDPSISPRIEELDQDYVETLTKDFDKLPPITIEPWDFIPGAKYRVIDGWHRTTAANLLGRKVMDAEVMNFENEQEAIVLSILKNLRHGKQLTATERDLAIEKLHFDEGMTVTQIASYLHLSVPRVSNILRAAKVRRDTGLTLSTEKMIEVARIKSPSDRKVVGEAVGKRNLSATTVRRVIDEYERMLKENGLDSIDEADQSEFGNLLGDLMDSLDSSLAEKKKAFKEGGVAAVDGRFASVKSAGGHSKEDVDAVLHMLARLNSKACPVNPIALNIGENCRSCQLPNCPVEKTMEVLAPGMNFRKMF